METLTQIYARHSGGTKFNDKNTIHSYVPTYEALLAPYRETAKRVCEIGIYDGHSLRMWEEYFSNAEVHGIDISETPLDKVDLRPMIAEGTHNVHICNAAIEEEVQKHLGDMKFDVIVEDSSHNFDDTLCMWEIFKSRLNPGAIYIVEDIQWIDIENRRKILEKLGFEIIDLRAKKGRYDDVLAVIRK